MTVRYAKDCDVENLLEIERTAFPPSEAATEDGLRKRIATYPECFWILENSGAVLSFIDGLSTNREDLSDEMFEDASMHDESGCWQMIFSVATRISERGHGYASKVMEQVILDSKKRGKKGIVLTCKEHLIPFYGRFGFMGEGVSSSTHGGVVWHQMRLRLKP